MTICDHDNKMKTFTLCYIATNQLKIIRLHLIAEGEALNEALSC
ncbi:hypothetical protein C3B79_0232 [Aeromonas hydrophila]|nr:hypothetical protein C3B79_0232 [Aeromonas hydrophila]